LKIIIINGAVAGGDTYISGKQDSNYQEENKSFDTGYWVQDTGDWINGKSDCLHKKPARIAITPDP